MKVGHDHFGIATASQVPPFPATLGHMGGSPKATGVHDGWSVRRDTATGISVFGGADVGDREYFPLPSQAHSAACGAELAHNYAVANAEAQDRAHASNLQLGSHRLPFQADEQLNVVRSRLRPSPSSVIGNRSTVAIHLNADATNFEPTQSPTKMHAGRLHRTPGMTLASLRSRGHNLPGLGV